MQTLDWKLTNIWPSVTSQLREELPSLLGPHCPHCAAPLEESKRIESLVGLGKWQLGWIKIWCKQCSYESARFGASRHAIPLKQIHIVR